MNSKLEIDLDSMEGTFRRNARFLRHNIDDAGTIEYMKGVVFHAFHGANREYIPFAIAIAQYGRARFEFHQEFKATVYQLLGEALVELIALTPREQKPRLGRSGETREETHNRLLGVLSEIYTVASDAFISRVELGELCAEHGRRIQEERFGLQSSNQQPLAAQFFAVIEQKRRSDVRRYLEARQESREKGAQYSLPFRKIAEEPKIHMQLFRSAMADITGRSIQEYEF